MKNYINYIIGAALFFIGLFLASFAIDQIKNWLNFPVYFSGSTICLLGIAILIASFAKDVDKG